MPRNPAPPVMSQRMSRLHTTADNLCDLRTVRDLTEPRSNWLTGRRRPSQGLRWAHEEVVPHFPHGESSGHARHHASLAPRACGPAVADVSRMKIVTGLLIASLA